MFLNEDEISMKKFTLLQNIVIEILSTPNFTLWPQRLSALSYNCVLVLQEMASIPPWQVEMQFIGTNATAGQ